MVQLAWIIYDKEGNLIKKQNHIIKPEWYTIPVESSNIHRITTQRAMEEWTSLIDVLDEFLIDIENVEYLVAHNISFDTKILWAELYRKWLDWILESKKQICTMHSSVDYCAIPWKYGNKWPNLTELHTKLFGVPFEEAHDALIDVQACAKCFFKLKEKWVL